MIEALLDAPMFITRWRWVAGVSLALPRFRGGKKVPPQLARMAAEDLIAAIFPDQVACAENLVGEREIPDHPLVRQTIADCLGEAMDIAGLERLLARLEAGEIRVVTRDLTEPSPLALEVLSARPYAYLDDAPLEERRTQAVMSRRWLAPEEASDIGRLDPEAIARVRGEAWPDPANPDELHDALVWLGFLGAEEAQPAWRDWFLELARENRVARSPSPPIGGRGRGPVARATGRVRWVAPQFRAWPPPPHPNPLRPRGRRGSFMDRGRAVAAVSGAVARSGNRPADLRARGLCRRAMVARGGADRDPARETGGAGAGHRGRACRAARDRAEGNLGGAHRARNRGLCDARALYARRGSRGMVRAPAARADSPVYGQPAARRDPAGRRPRLPAFSARLAAGDGRIPAWKGRTPSKYWSGSSKVSRPRPAAWETEILPARLDSYEPSWLDDQCLAGRIAWARLRPRNGGDRSASPVRTTPIALLARRHAGLWASLSAIEEPARPSSRAQAVVDFIRQYGASFFDELVEGTGLLRPQVEEALGELVALGIVTSDSFAGLRALLRKPAAGGRRRTTMFGMESAGRWALARRLQPQVQARPEAVEHLARTLLLRYGVVFWRLIEREAPWLPPWRDLLRVYRRLEARGEIRGGRFVAGFSGEQFALAEAVGMLREVRRKPPSGSWVSLSGADPLNLVGILTPGPKLAALTGNRLLYRDGLPVALFAGGEAQFLETLDPATQWEARKALLRGAVPPSLVALS